MEAQCKQFTYTIWSSTNSKVLVLRDTNRCHVWRSLWLSYLARPCVRIYVVLFEQIFFVLPVFRWQVVTLYGISMDNTSKDDAGDLFMIIFNWGIAAVEYKNLLPLQHVKHWGDGCDGQSIVRTISFDWRRASLTRYHLPCPHAPPKVHNFFSFHLRYKLRNNWYLRVSSARMLFISIRSETASACAG